MAHLVRSRSTRGVEDERDVQSRARLFLRCRNAVLISEGGGRRRNFPSSIRRFLCRRRAATQFPLSFLLPSSFRSSRGAEWKRTSEGSGRRGRDRRRPPSEETVSVDAAAPRGQGKKAERNHVCDQIHPLQRYLVYLLTKCCCLCERSGEVERQRTDRAAKCARL